MPQSLSVCAFRHANIYTLADRRCVEWDEMSHVILQRFTDLMGTDISYPAKGALSHTRTGCVACRSSKLALTLDGRGE